MFPENKFSKTYIDGLAQHCSNSSAEVAETDVV